MVPRLAIVGVFVHGRFRLTLGLRAFYSRGFPVSTDLSFRSISPPIRHVFPPFQRIATFAE